MTEEQIKSLQSTGGDHLAATEKNILGNHLHLLWEATKSLKAKQGGRVDVILDNG
jgi:damage-control phosphatase, subfamily III